MPLYEHQTFYPLGHSDIWMVLIPEYFEECALKCESSATIHLYNNIINTIGCWKDIAPPEGSFLHHLLKVNELPDFYKDNYPTRVMAAVVENFRLRQNGKALGVKTLLRELVPSVGRTIRHYRK